MLEKKVSAEASTMNVVAEPLLVGSLARDTWIRGEADIDLFILFPPETGRSQLEKIGISLAQRVAGGRGVKVYAEHPYIRTSVDGFSVDLVPALKVEAASKRVTAVDRTPFHLRYLLGKLTDPMRADVRILKKFMKGVGAYGAESRRLGFSGFVCELLTVSYGSFESLVESASRWRPPTIVKPEPGGYSGPESHLVVVDPTDASRNAAAAVSLESYATFIAACQHLLANPSRKFFFPEPELRLKQVDGIPEQSHLLMLKLRLGEVVDEVGWSELRSSAKGVAEHLGRRGFSVADHWFWFEHGVGYMVFELDTLELPPTEIRQGPQVYDHDSFTRFYAANRDRIVRGPWIRADRWVAECRRATTRVSEALSTPREIDLSPSVRRNYDSRTTLTDEHALEEAKSSPDRWFNFMLFLNKKPPWLE